MRLAWLHRDLAELSDETTQTLPLLQSLYDSLLPCWAGVPRNEEEALELALKYHADSLHISAFTRHEANEIMALLMMGRICIKLDRFDAAREHLVMARQETRDIKSLRLSRNKGKRFSEKSLKNYFASTRSSHRVMHKLSNLLSSSLPIKFK